MSGARSCREFRGKRVLIVESELLVPFTLYRAMERLGAEVVGPVGFLEDVSMLIGGSHVDGAILDSRMRPDERRVVHQVLKRMKVPFVVACGCMSCISGKDGCYRLSDAEGDLAILGRALFGGGPAGTQLHRHGVVSTQRNYRPSDRGRPEAHVIRRKPPPPALRAHPI